MYSACDRASELADTVRPIVAFCVASHDRSHSTRKV
jgi:hypothetical protein